MPVVLLGAFARDLIFDHIHGIEDIPRATMDIDTFSLGLLAGARYLYIDGMVDVLIVDIDESQNAWNGIVGFDARYDFSNQWHLYGHVDAGTGDSKFTWQALVPFENRVLRPGIAADGNLIILMHIALGQF